MTELSILISQPDDAAAARLRKAFAAAPDMRVIGIARDLMETFSQVEDHLPKVVVVAESLVFAPEFEVMCALFDTLDVRWLVAGDDTVRARTVPGDRSSSKADLFALRDDSCDAALLDSVRALARAGRAAAPRADKGAGATGRVQGAAPARITDPMRADRLILIGASTGGVEALIKVLSTFPAHCPPTVVCQHTGRGFGRSLVSLLDHQCAPRVVAAEPDMPLPDGTICVAAGMPVHAVVAGAHGLRVRLREGAPVSGHRPSVDVLFRSALPIARQTIGVLLTGMGRDGAEGLLELRQRGAATLAQDETTSVVYGMPRAAVDLGAVGQQVAIDEMGAAILEYCMARPARRGAVG